MSSQSSVSYLADFCCRKKHKMPVYEFQILKNRSFECTLDVLGLKTYGKGRAKRLAKVDAATKMLQFMCKSPENYDLDEQITQNFASSTSLILSESESDEMPPIDNMMMLRNYCLQKRCPLPQFELVANSTGYTAICTLLSIRRQGSGSNKKDAKQLAAFNMLKSISVDNIDTTVEKINKKRFSEHHDRFKYFNAYIDLLQSDEKPAEYAGIKLADRHNFFANFNEKLKTAAFAVLDGTYDSEKAQAMDVFKALELTPEVSDAPTLDKPMIMISVDCELDVLFIGEECNIYRQIIDYFKIMLK